MSFEVRLPGVNPSSAPFQLCALGSLVHLPEPQFPRLLKEMTPASWDAGKPSVSACTRTVTQREDSVSVLLCRRDDCAEEGARCHF